MLRVVAALVLGLAACTKIGAPSKPRADAVADSAGVPCAVSRILASKCATCHGHPTRENAPMPLTTWDELHALTPSRRDAGVLVHEQIALRIHDRERPMPPPGQPQLSVDELSTLDIWLGADAPGGRTCEAMVETSAPADAPQRDDTRTNTGGEPGRPSTVDAGTVSTSPAPTSTNSGQAQSAAGSPSPKPDASSEPTPAPDAGMPPTQPVTNPDAPVPPADGECEWVDLLARSDESYTPYRVAANASDEYRCFVFDRKLDVRTHAIAFKPVADNVKVLQHWVLYTLESLSTRDVVTSCDYTAGYRMISAGAQGTDPWYFPPEVGIDVGRGLFMLEVHYHNAGKPETTDQSGVRVCLSSKPRPKVATVSWLGVERFVVPAHAVDHVVSNRCKPTSREPIHLLRYFPHMNRLGTRTSLRVDHADGTSDVLHNASYAIDSQKTYAIPYVMQPGDSLLATCYYNNPGSSTVTLGFKASDEMCNHFVVAYPSLALTNDAPSGWSVACQGPP